MAQTRWTHIGAALGVISLASVAHAAITIQFTTYNLGGSAESNTLAANGWKGVLLTAVSDSNPIAGFDVNSTNLGQQQGVNGIITGTFEQRDFKSGATFIPVVQSTTPTAPAGSTVDLVDSFFSDFPGLNFGAVNGAPLIETNNHLGGPANPLQTVSNDYSFSPLVSSSSVAYGVGGSIQGAGLFSNSTATSIPLAFVIVPSGSTIHFVGDVSENVGNPTHNILTTNFTVAAVPEPASAGVLVLGVTALLARRRRKA